MTCIAFTRRLLDNLSLGYQNNYVLHPFMFLNFKVFIMYYGKLYFLYGQNDVWPTSTSTCENMYICKQKHGVLHYNTQTVLSAVSLYNRCSLSDSTVLLLINPSRLPRVSRVYFY